MTYEAIIFLNVEDFYSLISQLIINLDSSLKVFRLTPFNISYNRVVIECPILRVDKKELHMISQSMAACHANE